MGVLDCYEPRNVLHYFEEISSVPRGSGKEEKIADYLVQFAQDRGLFVRRDAYHNVLIKKPATPGYEHCPAMILQGHSDMVCIREEGFAHDFEKDGLELYVEGDRIMARSTTLGADNGIALGYGLAVLDSSHLPHPPLEVVFTAAEEIGMVGVKHFDMSWLSGKNMISFDSGGFTEGRIYVGCAGGERFEMRQRLLYSPRRGGKAFRITVSGLQGGHAGGDMAKGRGNATVILGRLLQKLAESPEAPELLWLRSGDPNNPVKHAIPDGAEVQLALGDDGSSLLQLVQKFHGQVRLELGPADENVQIQVEEIQEPRSRVLTHSCFQQVADILLLLPDGVSSMHKYFTDTPETSCNAGAVDIEDDEIRYYVSTRSSKESGLDFLKAKLDTISREYGLQTEKSERILGWDYNPDSPLRKLIEAEYTEMYGEKPRFKITHASTECGMFKRGIPQLDVISIGPIIYEEHTVNEYMGIFSVNELWKFLCQILKKSSDLI